MGSLFSKYNEKKLLDMDSLENFHDNKIKVDLTSWEKDDYVRRQQKKNRYFV